jgi:hypothetical protein
MPRHEIEFSVPGPSTLMPPSHLLRTGSYSVTMDQYRGVTITGTRDGLLYLAEVLVRCALSGYPPSFHTHLPLESTRGGPNVEADPELTIFAAQDQETNAG